MELLLGIDVGTTFCKAGVLSLDGAELARGRAPTPWRREAGTTEADPGAILDAALLAARRSIEGAPPGRVVALGVTSLGETGALLDPRGRTVAPALAWHDPRGEREAVELTQRFGAREFTVLTGSAPAPIQSLFKYRWLRAHHPESARGTRWLSLGEWVVHALGGDAVAEPSLASRTGLLDVARGAWSPELLELSGAPRGMMPELVPAGHPVGRVRRGLDEARGAVLAVAGHDHTCAAIGAGAARDGDVFDSCGTAEGFVRALEQSLSAADVLRANAGGVNVVRHVLPGRLALLGGFESGLTLERFLDLLGVSGDGPARQRLDAAALDLGQDAGVVPVNAATVERAISRDGMLDGQSPARAWRALLEALAGKGASMLAAIESVAGPTQRLVVAGGSARSAAVRAVKRAHLGPFELAPVEEAGVRGAALIAGMAAGLYASFDELPPPAERCIDHPPRALR